MAIVNMNEQMNQLGQIGSVGYAPTDAVVDQLVGRAKRARAIRQGSAAVIGSLGAISLGLLGAQIFVSLTSDEDAASIPIRDPAFTQSFGALKEPGYTGLGKTPEELAAAWAKVESAATITPAAPAPAAPAVVAPKTTPVTCEYSEKTEGSWVYYKSTETGCVWKKLHEVDTVPDGWIDFGGVLGECKTYTDSATGDTVFAAYIDAGESYKKIVKCEGSDPAEYRSGSYRYIYNNPYLNAGWQATLSGTTCTGFEKTEGTIIYQYSCSPNYGSNENPWKPIGEVLPSPSPTE